MQIKTLGAHSERHEVASADMETALLRKRHDDARKLKAVWKQKLGRGGGHRKRMAGLYGASESWIGLCINGHAEINIVWRLRFSEYLATPPHHIWPDFTVESAVRQIFPPYVAELLQAALRAQPELVNAARALLQGRPDP